MKFFKERRDNQIMSLELLSIAYGIEQCEHACCYAGSLLFMWRGISTFAKYLEGKNVVIFSDNKGAEAAVAKGE